MRILLYAAIAVAVVLVLLRLAERRLVFFPNKWRGEEPTLRAPALPVEEVWMTTSDGIQIHGWYVPRDSAVASLVMAHGNAGNVSDRASWLALLREKIPVNLFMFDYRGYGKSEGAPSEEGCYRDAEAAFDWLKTKTPQLPIVAHGHSLGGAVVIELARRRTLHGLIVESSFTHSRDMAKLMFGPLPVYWLSSMKWANTDKVATLTLPKLFLHGETDGIIPFRLGQALYAQAAEPKRFVALAHADHNDTFLAGGELYYDTIRDFILALAPARPGRGMP
jgi:fermentation-respiration switch protein FrsA (DUF1100 family)